MAGSLIGKAAKLVKGKKKPNKKTRIARSKRKNLVKAMKAEDRDFGGFRPKNLGERKAAGLPKPSTQSKKKRSKAKAKATFYQKQRKADRKDDEVYFKKYGKKNDIPF